MIKDKKFEQMIINRDKVCVCCKGDRHLEIHQLHDDVEKYKGVIPENYVTVCIFCHEQYHAYYEENKTINFINFLRGDYEYQG